jgi:hypothetical protein
MTLGVEVVLTAHVGSEACATADATKHASAIIALKNVFEHILDKSCVRKENEMEKPQSS